ncbi:MAG: response regulator [Bacteroidales bacterium]|nr:response regulator [Bacteroidales bacterium]
MENSSTHQDYNQAVLRYSWDHLVFLIAEDIEMNYLFLAEALKKTGVKLLWAVNGLQAVEICKTTEKIDMVITDIQMPEMDGFAATREITKMRPETPIIGYTAYSYEGVRDKMILAGAKECLIKPFEPKKLLLEIRKYLFHT